MGLSYVSIIETVTQYNRLVEVYMKEHHEHNQRIENEIFIPETFFHGTKANLKTGDFLKPGYKSNFGKGTESHFVYLTSTLDAAKWGAELAAGDESGRIYCVEPTGPIEDDPNLTDQKYRGNPTKSYRTTYPLKIVGEVVNWEGHSPQMIQNMLDNLSALAKQGIEAIND